MNQYLLSTYRVEGEVPGAPGSPEEMQVFMQRVMALEAEMDEKGAFVFGGALHGTDAASVYSPDVDRAKDGTFANADAHVAGFYIINAPDVETAREWAAKAAAATNHPIELRPFAATGKVADHMPDA